MKTPSWLHTERFDCTGCSGTGKCQFCNLGETFTGRYCSICHSTGHCQSCGGTGEEIQTALFELFSCLLARFRQKAASRGSGADGCRHLQSTSFKL